ncbi:hypothetical protein PAL_GLEAN10024375 [Pteropus alecto]|uniref:Uncharacterized protein n=1 Tax=Pteropus alecto TaxID=9402 RepID=L5JY08_PTEAL|nr:hypothetical protein PAL_GLEAN10024375 [Pteropus alecto]
MRAKRWRQNLLGLAWRRAQLQLLSPTVPLRSCDVSELSLDTQLPQRDERPFRETGEMEEALALPSILQVRGGSIRAQERRGVNVPGDLRVCCFEKGDVEQRGARNGVPFPRLGPWAQADDWPVTHSLLSTACHPMTGSSMWAAPKQSRPNPRPPSTHKGWEQLASSSGQARCSRGYWFCRPHGRLAKSEATSAQLFGGGGSSPWHLGSQDQEQTSEPLQTGEYVEEGA